MTLCLPGRALAAALALALPAGAQGEPAPAGIEVVLADFRFVPTDLRLPAGKPVTLTFVNAGSGGHNFAAPQFFAAAGMDAAARAALGKKGVVELDKGESRSLTLVPRAGHYEVKCTHFLHSGMGMKGSITVE